MDDEDFAELFRKLRSQPGADTTWRDVGAEFEALGKTLGDVVRRALRYPDGDEGLSRLRESLGAVVSELNRAVAGSSEAQQTRDQLVQLREAIRAATARASDELRPELLSMLRQANVELRRLASLDK